MCADPTELNLQNSVLAISKNNRCNIQILARLGPQRLQRVHGAAIGLQINHPPVWAGYCGASSSWHTVANRPTCKH